MRCLLCKGQDLEMVHKGVRDAADINVLKCLNCGLVQLDDKSMNSEAMYAGGGMQKKGYTVSNDKVGEIAWDDWVKETELDDDRRYAMCKSLCQNKRVLEFGCGNGGFLRRIAKEVASVVGIELMDEAREHINYETKGEKVCYKYLNELREPVDVICSFHVIEHLNEPDKILHDLYSALSPGGLFICETPNADNALTCLYKSNAYDDFSYWSEHVYLFNSNTLSALIERNGFETIENTQFMRYTLANHLFWLANDKPGGHIKWKQYFGDSELDTAYERALVRNGMADTLWYVGRKRE